MKSLSYTNNMQSLEKLLLMISTEGLMAHKCLAPAAAGIIWEENNTHTNIRVSWRFSPTFQVFSFIPVPSWVCKHKAVRKLDSL